MLKMLTVAMLCFKQPIRFAVIKLSLYNALNQNKIAAPKFRFSSFIKSNAYKKPEILGLKNQALKQASKPGSGPQQRVSIARALINDPAIIIGDEPTGNLVK